MSDLSNSSSSSKRRLSQIDDNIEHLTQEINTLNDVFKTEFECSLMAVKMKREKLKVLSTCQRTQEIVNRMEVMVAESDLFLDTLRLKNLKRRKLDRNEGNSQVDTPRPPQVTPPTTTTVSVQTIESMSNKKKKRRHSSSRTSPVDISSDETVIIPTTNESSASFVEASQTLQTSSLSLFTQTPANKSDSEVSLSSSIRAEFDKPYIKTHTEETVKKSTTKKSKSESKDKCKNVSKNTQSPTAKPKTVADPTPRDPRSGAASTSMNSGTGAKKSTASATYVPVRHNMGVFQAQRNLSTRCPNIQHNSEQAGSNHTCNFYGTNRFL